MLKKKPISLLLVISMLVSVFALFGVTANAVEDSTITDGINQREDEFYSEIVVTASKGDIIEIDFNCELSGFRIIQTFGMNLMAENLKLKLIGPSETQLNMIGRLPNRSYGYNYNALIGADINSAYTYTIVVDLTTVPSAFVDQDIRISVTAISGEINNDNDTDSYLEYEDIFCYKLNQNEPFEVEFTYYVGDLAKVVLINPEIAGNYQFSCDAEHVYFMDPTSNEELKKPQQISDDTFYLTANVPYYLVLHPGWGGSEMGYATFTIEYVE